MPHRDQINHACPIRDVLDRIGDAWSLLVMLELGRGACRFNALRRVVDGISQRMLAVTLRQLERDGLVSRKVLPMSPPQVEYALTDLGRDFLVPVMALAEWTIGNSARIDAARAAYHGKLAAE